MGSPIPPVAPLAPMVPLQPVWATTLRRQGIIAETLNTGPAGGGCPPRSAYRPVPYDPVAGGPLVRLAMLYRTYFDLWDSGLNVAVVQYTTPAPESETRVVIATSSTYGSHSEEKLLLFLQAEQAEGRVGHIDSIYTERQPCNGGRGHRHCDHLLQSSPLLTPPTTDISYSYPYDRSIPTSQKRASERAFRQAREQHEQAFAQQNGLAQAVDAFGSEGPGTPNEPRVTLILRWDFEEEQDDWDMRERLRDPAPPPPVADSARAYEGADLV